MLAKLKNCIFPQKNSLISQKNRWEFFDLSLLGKEISGYAETLFDGRYIYYGPERNYDLRKFSHTSHSYMLRVDTTLPFSQKESWQVFDIKKFFPEAAGSVGMVFDGRYIIFAPFRKGGPGEYLLNSIVVKYDTHNAFGFQDAWSKFDLKHIHEDAGGFVGADCDDEYAYFTPYVSNEKSIFVRYKLSAPIDDVNAWEYVNLLEFNQSLKGYIGCQYANGYVYFSPCFSDITNLPHGNMLRFNTKKSFTDKNSWEVMDFTNALDTRVGYDGMSFDGRYIYYAPYYCKKPWDNNKTHGNLLRFDTTSKFKDEDAWESFDLEKNLSTHLIGFIGAGFDGQRIYLAPVANKKGYHGNVVCYDTHFPFQDKLAYSFFDISKLNKRCIYYDGKITSDGQHMYFSACGPNAMMARFRFA